VHTNTLIHIPNDGQSCHATNSNSLNIHIICHTHLDTGWVETYDEYYHRCKTSVLWIIWMAH
jgi:hypothetical protein